jgi:anti-sigma regulatory factor (Ser/Thr protein kinase)
MMVTVPIERRQQFRFTAPTPRHQGGVAEWRLSLFYSAAELHYLDVVPAVLGLMTQVVPLKPHQGALFLIISELFNNALDHGLLRLDSATKKSVGGFETYMQQRTERLARLEQGHIALSFLIHDDENRAVLDIDVTDSGPGFDYEGLLQEPGTDGEESRPYGRGIGLVRSLCADVVFSGVGNRVWARYLL